MKKLVIILTCTTVLLYYAINSLVKYYLYVHLALIPSSINSVVAITLFFPMHYLLQRTLFKYYSLKKQLPILMHASFIIRFIALYILVHFSGILNYLPISNFNLLVVGGNCLIVLIAYTSIFIGVIKHKDALPVLSE